MTLLQEKPATAIAHSVTPGIFKAASATLLHLLKKKNKQNEATFLLPTKYISQEAASVGLLINNLLIKRQSERTIFRTFFAGSYLDAISGALKIIRQNHPKHEPSDRKIFIYDRSKELSLFFHPLSTEDRHQLVPGLCFESDLGKAKKVLKEGNWIGFVYCYEKGDSLSDVEELFAYCKARHITIAFDESHLDNWYEEMPRNGFTSAPDIYIFGENITNREVPFGAFSMSAEVYKPWNSIGNCLTHSSSYTGNTLALAMILELFSHNKLTRELKLPLQFTKKHKYQTYATYINPAISWIFYVTGLSPEIKRAKGSQLIIESKGRETLLLDAVAGSGCCLRGHNPDDLIDEVFERHDPCYDYWADLSRELSKLSNMPHVFPAVSGSSSVDIAIILALLANPSRTRIITFKNNYSGKTLISMNMTRFACYTSSFHPLYFDVVEIDPFAKDAHDKLSTELNSGKVALIWFEILQGQSLDPIPTEIIDLINKQKEKGGYLIGIDEILTGFFRTGKFLCSEGKILEPDLITLAKGISDMTFPMAAVLLSEHAYKIAKKTHPILVSKLKSQFVNQIGSNIALHGLKKSLKMGLSNHVHEMKNLFYDRLRESVAQSPLHEEILGEGLLLYVRLNKKAFPVNILGEEFVEFLMSNLYLKKGKLLFLNSRLTPSLGITRDEMEELCKRLKSVLENTNRFQLFISCISQIVQIYTHCGWQKIKEGLGILK